MDSTYEDSENFVLPIRHGKVVRVYDGDTVTITFLLHQKLYRTQVRLLGIDAPEIRAKSEVEKRKAREARDALHGKLLNQVVELKNLSHEKKWGRLLAELWLDGENVNAWMLSHGHAVAYAGDKKTHDWNSMPEIEPKTFSSE
jgi:endonuclease YncB( thermonuclease family)